MAFRVANSNIESAVGIQMIDAALQYRLNKIRIDVVNGLHHAYSIILAFQHEIFERGNLPMCSRVR